MAQASLGILMLDTSFPRIPGDVGNARSYSFPVKMKVVPGATVRRVVFEADPSLRQRFRAAALELETEGVCAITSSCGFLSPLQQELARAVRVPVFLSSLMQVPLAYAMTRGRVAILTANQASLTEEVLDSAGIPGSVPVATAGLQDVPAFREPILKDGAELQKDVVEQEMLRLVARLLRDYPDISAFVFECHNLAPYSRAVQVATERPVFDIISFAGWVYRSVNPQEFPGE
jgi:hypothetical protein